ncbi:MAG: carboxypeptidase M32 [Myxococcales bacterium]|nr:carboxypeptidase M32 [Myxococcales bacterium]
MKSHEALLKQYGRIARVDDALGVLHWDMAVMMPAGGAEARTEQIAALRVISHELATDPRIAEWLADLDEGGLSDWERANVRLMRRAWLHATAVPAELVEALSRACARCEMTWRTARKADDFKTLSPLLTEVLRLVREEAGHKAEALGVATPYDALLDLHDPGSNQARVDALFDPLAETLPKLIDEVIEHQARHRPFQVPAGPFPTEVQAAVGRRIIEAIGFDPTHGRVDISHHPFCGGAPDDVRITTRYDAADFGSSMMGLIHETGHAMYERGLPAKWRYQPVGRVSSMAMHESQSLLIEMQACRTPAFFEFAGPLLREAFGGSGPAWETENLHRWQTRVERGLIRVDADEVTYPAHVILRYRLEKALIGGTLEIADLPDAWAESMKALVGIAPTDNRDGVMQDIHWMDGAFGYFPTYTLGAMIAAQLFAAAVDNEPDLLAGIARGDFRPLVGWLRRNVHEWGSHDDTDALLTRATGRPLDAAAFRRHLSRRYLDT